MATTRPPTLESFILLNEADLSKLPTTNPKVNNLSRSERQALNQLANNKHTTIKSADKGSAVVIMNTTDYILMSDKLLSDTKFYKRLDNNPTDKHNREVNKILDEMLARDEIDITCHNYLYNQNPRTPTFYTLPKIHKGKSPPPGRPIVSANNSPTEKISSFVDFFLNPTIPFLKSYIKDTTHFLQQIKNINSLPANTLLATLDVTSLYTNIPNKEGLKAAAKTLGKYRPGAKHPQNQSLIQLLDLVLTRNNFEFNGQHYLQISGTAMGTKTAPSHANNFMGHFEEAHVYTYCLQPLIWLRFIDDIFMIWTHGKTELINFVANLNSCHETIKFTAEISKTTVNFLDTTVSLSPNGTLEVDLYSKPTDSHNYLLYTSAHTLNCKISLPYSQFLRIRRICSSIDNYDKHSKTLTYHFLRRGYPEDLIENAYILARRKDRDSLLEPKTKPKPEPNKDLFLITTYQPGWGGPRDIVKKNWDFLTR